MLSFEFYRYWYLNYEAILFLCVNIVPGNLGNLVGHMTELPPISENATSASGREIKDDTTQNNTKIGTNVEVRELMVSQAVGFLSHPSGILERSIYFVISLVLNL